MIRLLFLFISRIYTLRCVPIYITTNDEYVNIEINIKKLTIYNNQSYDKYNELDKISTHPINPAKINQTLLVFISVNLYQYNIYTIASTRTRHSLNSMSTLKPTK